MTRQTETRLPAAASGYIDAGWRRAICRVIATALLTVSLTVPARAADTPSPPSTPAHASVPPACLQPLSATQLQTVANFIWSGCPQWLNWPHDAAPRMSGPSPSGARSVHGFVFNYYAPSVYAWLKAGRPEGGIPDGALIVKQMYNDNNGQPGAINGWTIIVKKKDATYDGWFWGYVDPQKQNGGDGLYGGQFYDPNCVGCHASASTRELTFSSLVNIAGNFGGTRLPEATGLRGGSLHARVMSLTAAAIDTPKASVLVPGPAPAVNAIPNTIPPQSASVVNVGAAGPTGFVTSDACSGCHDASNLAFEVQSNMSWPPNTPPRNPPTQQLKNISPFGEWGASMMGLSGRDPVFQAQRESETLTYPSVAAEIDNACYTCHGVMGKRQLTTDKPNALFTHADFLATTGPNATYGALARDGISCLSCHRMLPDGLGTPASFTGNFKTGDAATVYGPFKDIVTFPMKNAIGMTPMHGTAISDPAMCGSCHVVETPILDKTKTYNRTTFGQQPKSHEQTTYLEWLNSRYQTKTPVKPGATPQTCQQCHMPGQIAGQRIASKIANIEDDTYLDANGKPFPNTAPAADITLKTRADYSRHTLVGANVFVLEMFKQFGAQLGLTQGDRNYDTTNFAYQPRLDLSIQETTQQVQSATASVAIVAQRRSAKGLDVDVEVKNQTGHKFPSGVGFRRAFIEFTALDQGGNVVWSSGRSNDQGVIVNDAGQPLPTEFSKTAWQPHWKIITGSQSVQIYEARDKDLQGLLTTSFLGLAKSVKDNRLMPAGWDANGPYASWTAPVAVPAVTNAGYYNGSGSDRVTYRLPASVAGNVRLVRAVLHYQSIPPYYLQDRFTIGGNNPATAQLRALVQQVDYSKTAARGWKLPVASATAVVR
ncbi:MAG: cytochrome P460 family protein [Burkholderiales bacterium]|nr:cytochrome P460 family protein [Burkholderiales bacterium]